MFWLSECAVKMQPSLRQMFDSSTVLLLLSSSTLLSCTAITISPTSNPMAASVRKHVPTNNPFSRPVLRPQQLVLLCARIILSFIPRLPFGFTYLLTIFDIPFHTSDPLKRSTRNEVKMRQLLNFSPLIQHHENNQSLENNLPQ
jgi:hypothetical protein